MPNRIDKLMVDKGLVRTRSQARMLIKQGDVKCNGKLVTKPGLDVLLTDEIEITNAHHYVSRGAFKLLKAIEEFELDFSNRIIADCGASTGGFTQVALENNATKVYAIDVGHDQLADLIKNDERVINMEGINLKNALTLDEKVDFCVADLSFISIKKIYPTMKSLLKTGGKSIILIKPQFEAGPDRIGKGGIVSEKFQKEILEETLQWFKDEGHIVEKTCISPVKGKSGNTEYLALIS